MRRHLLTGLLGLCVCAGCGSRQPGSADLTAPPPTACILLPGPVATEEVRLALGEPVDPQQAPLARNESERLIFAQLYETLVQIDCAGELRGGLAEQWESREDGLEWRFVLRPGACFTDGTSVRARDIRHAWTATRTRGDLFLPLAWISAVSEMDPNERIVTVRLAIAMEDARIFAHPALAIYRPDPSGTWPLGTGPYLYARGDGAPSDPIIFDARHGGPRLACVVRPGANPRDLMDAGYDLLLARDRTALEYAAHDPTRVILPLPWDRLYLLVRAAPHAVAIPWVPLELRTEFADQIVAAEAVGRDELSYGDEGGPDDPRDCQDQSLPPLDTGLLQIDLGSPPVEPVAARLVYRTGDDDARRIAERLAALAGQGAGGARTQLLNWIFGDRTAAFPRTTAISGVRLRQAQIMGEELTYLLAIERTLGDPCLTLQGVVTPNQTWTVVPLVATRASLIARADLQGIWTAWNGVPRFLGEEHLP